MLQWLPVDVGDGTSERIDVRPVQHSWSRKRWHRFLDRNQILLCFPPCLPHTRLRRLFKLNSQNRFGAVAVEHLESWNASVYLHDQHTTSILPPNHPTPPSPLSHPHLPRGEPPSRWPSRAGPAPAGGWEGAGRRVERVRPSAGRRAGPASAGPDRSRGCHRRSIDGGGCVELALPLRSGCCGSAGVYPGRQSTPRESRDCRGIKLQVLQGQWVRFLSSTLKKYDILIAVYIQ